MGYIFEVFWGAEDLNVSLPSTFQLLFMDPFELSTHQGLNEICTCLKGSTSLNLLLNQLEPRRYRFEMVRISVENTKYVGYAIQCLASAVGDSSISQTLT